MKKKRPNKSKGGNFRSLAIRIVPGSLDQEAGTVEAILGSERRDIEWWDDSLQQYVAEVPLMSGFQIRGNRSEVALLDSHQMESVTHNFGIVDNIRVEGTELRGRLCFDLEKPAAAEAFSQYQRGFLRDVSMTYDPKMETMEHVPAGQSREYNGQVYDGPINLVHEWELVELSVCSVGKNADARTLGRTGARSRRRKSTKAGTPMKKLFKLKDGRELSMYQIDKLRRSGQTVTLADGTVLRSLADDYTREEMEEEEERTEMEGEDEESLSEEERAEMEGEDEESLSEEERAEMEGEEDEESLSEHEEKPASRKHSRRQNGGPVRSAAAERKRVLAIDNAAKIAGAPDNLRRQAIAKNWSVEEALRQFSKHYERKNGLRSVATGGNDRASQARLQALTDGVLLRTGLLSPDGVVRRNHRQDGEEIRREHKVGCHELAHKFRHFGLQDLARHCLENSGVSTRNMSKIEILRAAMGRDPRYRLNSAFGGQGTSDFSTLLENVLNKTLVATFATAPVTWPLWCRKGSANDLRPHGLYQRSRFGSLPRIGEKAEVGHNLALSGKKESYTPATFSDIFALTDEVFINDDLNAFVDLPQGLANAAAYTVEEWVYYTLLSNPTMNEDSTALFASGHSNLASGGDVGAPSESTYNKMDTAFAERNGLNGKPINVQPAMVLVPPPLNMTARKLYVDQFLSGGTNEEMNIWRDMFLPIRSPLLKSGVTVQTEAGALTANGSATAWYGLADYASSQVGTFLVGFLDGQEAPTLDQDRPIDTLGTLWRVTLRFGVGVEDWRGLYKNPGA